MLRIVIPMAGESSRFKAEGIDQPKWQLPFRGQRILDFALQSLPFNDLPDFTLHFVTRHENFAECIEKVVPPKEHSLYKKIRITSIDQTRGQAETVFNALHSARTDSEDSLLIWNCDTYQWSESMANLIKADIFDGIVWAFKQTTRNSAWSFADIDEKTGLVRRVEEKNQISANALTGMYYFKRFDDFKRAMGFELVKLAGAIPDLDGSKPPQELYVAPLYNELIQCGRKIYADFAHEFMPLGTPHDWRVQQR